MAGATARLSHPQARLLDNLAHGRHASAHFRSQGNGCRSGLTLAWAVRRKLIEWDETARPHAWRITDLGRQVHERGSV